MMKCFFLFFMVLGFVSSTAHSQADEDARLKQIAREFDKREGAEGQRCENHRTWAKTEQGKADLMYLSEHYEGLSDMRKNVLPMELARTGVVEVVPLVKRALEDPRTTALSGVFFACRLSHFEPEYGKQLAVSLVPLLGKKHLGTDRALELLPTLDPALAGKTLFTDEWLSPEAPAARSVLMAFNDAGHPVPIERVRPLVEKWRASALADVKRKDQWAYAAALVALAYNDPQDAITKTDEWIAKYPEEAENVSAVFLIASGLSRLHDSLVDNIDSPKDLESLPDSAKFIFAVSIFELDWMNGGTSQAFSNYTGDYIPWVKQGYKAIGDKDRLLFIEKVCALFGTNGPSTDRKTRNLQMEKMRPPFSEQVEKWENEESPETKQPKRIPTDILLCRYAAKHAEELRPLLKIAPK
jgi:hypothetical protein